MNDTAGTIHKEAPHRRVELDFTTSNSTSCTNSVTRVIDNVIVRRVIVEFSETFLIVAAIGHPQSHGIDVITLEVMKCEEACIQVSNGASSHS